MHQPRVAVDGHAELVADRLVPEADAQQRDLAGEGLDDLARHAGLARGAGPGGDDHVRRLERPRLGDGDLVVADDADAQRVGVLAAGDEQLPDPLHEVVGEAVVVVEEEDHGAPAGPRMKGVEVPPRRLAT